MPKKITFYIRSLIRNNQVVEPIVKSHIVIERTLSWLQNYYFFNLLVKERNN
ncbi:hypothetical protein H1P_1900007 [Hyella patelloides LEGE 07179]|uniref:Transposase n=1 Tax=Hyella patelloides LEGE 07179 TaxID=945734 RepID=A0A563VP87_9CYAN|nr:hypothetical protein H1P_1900007 [Hyella patelloides LEGE 07179]